MDWKYGRRIDIYSWNNPPEQKFYDRIIIIILNIHNGNVISQINGRVKRSPDNEYANESMRIIGISID